MLVEFEKIHMSIAPYHTGTGRQQVDHAVFLMCIETFILVQYILYSCTFPLAAYISLDANGETLVVKSVQSERLI
jgi:hypothetical protein